MKGFILFGLLLLVLTADVFASIHDKDPWIESVCISNAKRRLSQLKADNESWVGLPWTRNDLINFAGQFDTDGDKAIDFQECEDVRNYYFEPYQLQIGETCDTVFRRCDCDGDGYITQWDFENSHMTCLREGKSGKLLWWLVGGKITEAGAFNGKQQVDNAYGITDEQMSG